MLETTESKAIPEGIGQMAKENLTCELAVIGGGPAGLAAAIEAAKIGARISLFDEDERPGASFSSRYTSSLAPKSTRLGYGGMI